jgi:hypothetical protein
MMRRPQQGGLLPIALLFFALTAVLTYPLSLHPASTAISRVPDTDLFMWTLAWDTHALFANPLSVFDANIYFPERRTLAFSENLIGDVVFAAPVLWLTGNPVLAMNVVALASCLLCGLGGFVLARKLGVGPEAAMLSGIVFAFAPPRFLRIGQLHLTSVHWMPFALAYLHAYFGSGRARDLRLSVGFFTLQALSSGHGAVFTSIALVGLVLYRVALGEPLTIARRLRDFGATGVLLLVPTILTILPYFAVQREMGLRRTLEDWAVPATTFLASPTHLHSFLLSTFSAEVVNQTAIAWLFPGYLPLLLSVIALAPRLARERRIGSVDGERPAHSEPSDARRDTAGLWRRLGTLLEALTAVAVALAIVVLVNGPFRWRVGETVILSARQPVRLWLAVGLLLALRVSLRSVAPLAPRRRLLRCLEVGRGWLVARRRDVKWYYVLLALLGFWLSIGPPWGLWPAVYWWPGFSFIRVPSRFTVMGMLGLAVLSGIGFERLASVVRIPARRALAIAAAVVLLAEFSLVPLNTTPVRVEIPAIDRWLDGRPKPFAIAEVPLPSFGAGGAWERRQTEYMLHSTAHWQKTVHGYSGLRPPRHEELYWQLRLFPDLQSLTSLVNFGVQYIVVHTDLYAPEEWPLVEARLAQFADWLQLEHQEGTGRVYRLSKP